MISSMAGSSIGCRGPRRSRPSKSDAPSPPGRAPAGCWSPRRALEGATRSDQDPDAGLILRTGAQQVLLVQQASPPGGRPGAHTRSAARSVGTTGARSGAGRRPREAGLVRGLPCGLLCKLLCRRGAPGWDRGARCRCAPRGAQATRPRRSPSPGAGRRLQPRDRPPPRRRWGGRGGPRRAAVMPPAAVAPPSVRRGRGRRGGGAGGGGPHLRAPGPRPPGRPSF